MEMKNQLLLLKFSRFTLIIFQKHSQTPKFNDESKQFHTVSNIFRPKWSVLLNT